MSPEAYFDCLYVVKIIENRFGDCSKPEIFNFAYLGCLLSLYDNTSYSPTSFWGYKFIANEVYAPYSLEVDSAIDKLVSIGAMDATNNYYKLTEKGAFELAVLSNLVTNTKRVKYLNASCLSAYSLPIGSIRRAVSNVASINKANNLKIKCSLFEDDINRMYDDFSILRQAIGKESKDLLIPSTIWIQCMAEKNKE